MNISVVATAFSGYGTLTIYMQFLESLKKLNNGDSFHFFIAEWMPKPDLKNVTYHVCSKRKGLHRIWFDFVGFKRESKRIGKKWDVIVSLQNVPVVYDKRARNIVYFHQALTLYNYPISVFDRFAKTYYLYHYIYFLYIKCMLRNANYVAVQTNVVKKLFSQKFSFPVERIGVFFPELEKYDVIDKLGDGLEKGVANFIYPGTANAYKEHLTLVEAMSLIKKNNPKIIDNVRIHFTAQRFDNKKLADSIVEKGLTEVFCFHGTMPHADLMKMYQTSDGLLFPSMIETIGLPLLEASAYGIPILANDVDYVHEVLNGYEGVEYIEPHNYEEWANKILDLMHFPRRYSPYTVDNNNSWERFALLIQKGQLK